jgi:hypothetical protein
MGLIVNVALLLTWSSTLKDLKKSVSGNQQQDTDFKN